MQHHQHRRWWFHGHIDSLAAGAISLRQAYEYWKAGAGPIEWTKEHKEFARTFESFQGDADLWCPGWRERLGVKAAQTKKQLQLRRRPSICGAFY